MKSSNWSGSSRAAEANADKKAGEASLPGFFVAGSAAPEQVTLLHELLTREDRRVDMELRVSVTAPKTSKPTYLEPYLKNSTVVAHDRLAASALYPIVPN